MKILFIYPNVTKQISPQLGICSIAAIAHQLRHECDIYDLTIIPVGEEVSTFISKLDSFKPDLLAISCRSNEWEFIVQLFNSVNVDDKLKIFGGPHATVAPEEVINIADIVVIGEGEGIFSELLQKIESKDDYTITPGCWIKQGDKIIKNEMAPLISNLDEIPLPLWKIFDDIHYYDSYIKGLFKGAKVVGTFESARGCPYACTYCTNDKVRGLYQGKGKWRREKSVERIVEEIRTFRDEYGLDCVYFVDEVMLTSIDRLERFRDLYSSTIGAPFVFMERPENMIDEKVRIIKQAGAHMVSIGIESGDENLRKNLLGRRHSNKTIVSAFQTAKNYNITTHAFTMVGFPGQDRESIEKTYKLLKEARPNTVQVSTLYPLRGTKLYDQVVREKMFDPKTPMPKSYYGESSLKFPNKRQQELVRWRYLLSNYTSRFPGFHFFMMVQPSQRVARIFILLHTIFRLLRKGKVSFLLKAIFRRT